MEYKDYYAILGVNKKATEEEIKKSYRRLARKYHPDVSKEANAEEKFKELQEAYEVLKDPAKRNAYDQLGSNWKQGQEFRPPPGWQQQGGQFYTTDFTEDMSGFSDFFANIFGRARTRGSRRAQTYGEEGFGDFSERGNDQHSKIHITLEEAFKGSSQTLQLQTTEQDSRTGQLSRKSRTIKVNIPAGALQGQKLRLAKQGNPGRGGGDAGDLYLEIDILPHPLFTLQGRDVFLVLPVTPWEAALGAEIKVPTLAGWVGLKLAKGSHAGQKLRLKGRGMPEKSGAGDQYAIVQIDTPPADTADKAQFYRNMSEVMPFNPRQHWPRE